MGDMGEFWRDVREYRRRFRQHCHECPTCAVAYGTGTKVAPGEPCYNCGWRAPETSALTGKPWRKVRRTGGES